MGGQRRQKILVWVLAVVALAAIAKFTVFSGGGDSNDTTPTSTPSVTVPDSIDSTTTTGGIPPSPNTFDVFGGKNPFEPAVQITTPTIATTTTGGGTTSSTGTTVPGQTTTTTMAPTNNPNNQLFTLNSITRQSNSSYVATVTIGSTGYSDILEGETFGPSNTYRFLQGTSDNCGNFQHGDVTFNICENSSTLK